MGSGTETKLNSCGEEIKPPSPESISHPGLEVHDIAWLISGIFALLAVLLSLYLIVRHLLNYTKPKIQKHIVRILLMVPVYAIDSWISFRFFVYATYINILRDAYEAFVIYTFVELLVQYLGGLENSEQLLKRKEKLSIPFPLNYIFKVGDPAIVGAKFLRRIKQGTIQYVILRPLTAVLAVFLQAGQKYCEGSVNPKFGWVYISIVLFVSVTIAMYALVAFYQNTKVDLAPYAPLLKFGSIKFVIFFSFWQGVVISGMVKVHIIKDTTYWTADNVATGTQNALICGEMLIAAIVHIWAFDYKPFAIEGFITPVFKSFLRAINVRDVVIDSHKHMIPTKLRKKLTIGSEQKQEPDTEASTKKRRSTQISITLPPDDSLMMPIRHITKFLTLGEVADDVEERTDLPEVEEKQASIELVVDKQQSEQHEVKSQPQPEPEKTPSVASSSEEEQSSSSESDSQ